MDKQIKPEKYCHIPQTLFPIAFTQNWNRLGPAHPKTGLESVQDAVTLDGTGTTWIR